MVKKTGVRAAAIIVRNTKVILMFRRKKGRSYWTFPGGGIEEGETGKEAVVRETKEETGLVCKKVRLLFRVKTYEDSTTKHPFYLCEVSDGEIVLGGPEAKRNNETNYYEPQWVAVKKVGKLNLLPEIAKKEFLRWLSTFK
jgi:mutator protein MutT